MKNIIDIHTNILLGDSKKSNPRILELYSKIKPNSKAQTNLIKKQILNINKKANFNSLLKSMKKKQNLD